MDGLSINAKLEELADLFHDMLTDRVKFSIDEVKKKRTNELMYSIRTYLLDDPGELIYEQDKNSIQRKLAAIDILWNYFDDEYHYDELFFGENMDFITNFASAYIKRAKMIRPTFFTVKKLVGKEFESYFREAIEAWLYGCKNASVIICYSLLEDLLRNKLCDLNGNYAQDLFNWEKMKSNPDYGMKELKKLAQKEKVLPNPLIKKLSYVQGKRNDAVHNLKSLTDEEAYSLILDTKEVVEYLLNMK